MTVAAVQFTGETTLDVQFILEAALVNFDELAVGVRERRHGTDQEARTIVDGEIERLLIRACEEVRIDFAQAEAEITPNTGTAVLRVETADRADELADALLRLASRESSANGKDVGAMVFRIGVHAGGRVETLRILRRLARLTAAAQDRNVFIGASVFEHLSRARQQRYHQAEPVDANYDQLMGHRRLVKAPDQSTETLLPNCFLIMPYNLPRSQVVLKTYISPACKMAGVVAMRSDWEVSREVIPLMLAALRDEPLALAYLGKPPWNSNVMLEIGYRLAVGRPLIIVRDKPSGPEAALPFDLSHLRVIELPDDAGGVPPCEEVKAAVAELTRTLRDRVESLEKDVWRHPHPTATAKFVIETEESVYLESSEEADRLFGMTLKGKSVKEFIELIGKHMSAEQHDAFIEEQQRLFGQVTAPQFFKRDQVPTASVPIVFGASRENGHGMRAYLPVIVNYWKLGGEVVLKVLYLEVTGALEQSDCSVFRVDLARRKRRPAPRTAAMAGVPL
jgi:hypothetical protein